MKRPNIYLENGLYEAKKAFLTWHARQGWTICSSTEHDSLL